MTRLIVPTAVFAVLMASSTDAFTVRPNNHMPPSSIYRTVTGTTSTTALQMNLFDRFSRVAKSNLNNILQSLEDPEKIMTQALEDMQVGPKKITKMA